MVVIYKVSIVLCKISDVHSFCVSSVLPRTLNYVSCELHEQGKSLCGSGKQDTNLQKRQKYYKM